MALRRKTESCLGVHPSSTKNYLTNESWSRGIKTKYHLHHNIISRHLLQPFVPLPEAPLLDFDVNIQEDL